MSRTFSLSLLAFRGTCLRTRGPAELPQSTRYLLKSGLPFLSLKEMNPGLRHTDWEVRAALWV